MKGRGDEPPPEDRGEAETAFNNEGRDNEVETNKLEFDDDDDDKPGDDQNNELKRKLNKRIGVEERQKTSIKKRILFNLGYRINKGDGPRSEKLFKKLKLTESEKTLKPNGMTFNGVKIIILEKDGEFKFSKSKDVRSEIYKFKTLAEEARKEHTQTAVSDIEEVVPDVFVDDGHAKSIRSNSLEKLKKEISDREEKIRPLLDGQELREFNGLLNPKATTIEGKIKFLEKTEVTYWEKKVNDVEGDPRRKELYESIVEVAKLKADQLRLEANLKPKSETAQSILAEETENNPLTRFERFKKWAKENLGGISVIAISVAGIITTIVMGMKTVVVGGAKAASKFGKFLAKLAEKAGPVLGALLNLPAGLLKLGAKGISFLAENLWILAVIIAYALWEKAKSKK